MCVSWRINNIAKQVYSTNNACRAVEFELDDGVEDGESKDVGLVEVPVSKIFVTQDDLSSEW